MKLHSKILSTFFGIGYFPLAPGTITSAIIVLLYKFWLHRIIWPVYLLLVILLFIVGIFVSGVYSRESKKRDPRPVVIDEAAGQFLALFLVSPHWFPLGLSFFFFRLFDITKPFFIKRVEDFPGGLGIMLDDILAAAYAGILTHLYLLLK
jgi:phosphatidylglycerophosphatase A